MAIAVVVVLLVIGSVIFHFLSPWWFTPIASDWGAIDLTIDVTFWVTGIVFVGIFSVIISKIFRQARDVTPAKGA